MRLDTPAQICSEVERPECKTGGSARIFEQLGYHKLADGCQMLV
jgi:hypothetical protein